MRSFRALFALGLLPLLLACLTNTPTPVVDNRLQVMVAEQVAAAMTQTALAVPPTVTLTPTSTSTPGPTSTPTAQPVGSSLTKQADGSTLFTDDRAGYAVTLPEGWLAVRVNEQEFVEAASLAESTNPLMKETLSSIQNENPSVLRLFAVDIKDETAQSEPVTAIKFIWDEKRDLSFSEAELQLLADDLTKTTPGLEVTSMNIFITQTGIQFSVIESKTTGSNDLFIFQKRVIFKAKIGTVSAILTTGKSLKVEIVPVFDAIMDTVRLSAR